MPGEEEGADMENQDKAEQIWRTRCNPGAWKPLIQGLSRTMVDSIKQSQFGRNMLKMQLTSLEYRQLCTALMRTAVYHEEENLIELRLDGGSLWINEAVIEHVLDMPRGSDKEPQASEAEVELEYRSMWRLLDAVSARYPDESVGRSQRVQQEAGSSQTRSNNASSSQRRRARRAPPQLYAEQRKMFTPAKIRCLFSHWQEPEFNDLATEPRLVKLLFAVKVERLLLPSQGPYVTKDALRYVYHVDKIDKLDWPYLVFERMKRDLNLLDKDRLLKYMACCVPVFMVSTRSCCK